MKDAWNVCEVEDNGIQHHSDFIDDLIAEKVATARAGDKESAKWILGEFVASVNSNTGKDGLPLKKPSGTGTQIHEEVIRYVAECFQLILDGVPADKAIGINSGESGADTMPVEKRQQREYEWCLDVLRNQSSGRYEKLKDAKAATARKFKVSISAVEKAWKRPAAKLSAKIAMHWETQGK